MSSRALQEALTMPSQSTESQGPTKVRSNLLCTFEMLYVSMLQACTTLART